MNKLILFSVLALTIPFASFAAPVKKSTVTVEFKGHLAHSKSYRMQVTPLGIRLNGIEISSHVMPALAKEMRTLLHPKKDITGGCAAGEYFHHVKGNKLNRRTSGCLGSPTAERLLSSLRRIEGLSFLRRLPASTKK